MNYIKFSEKRPVSNVETLIGKNMKVGMIGSWNSASLRRVAQNGSEKCPNMVRKISLN